MIVVLLIVCMLFCASGCANLFLESKEAIFAVDGYDLQITADDSFHQTDATNFDLQITDKNAYISIMAYKYIDLAQNSTPLDIYDTQNEDIFSRRTAVTIIEEAGAQSLPQYVVEQTLYSAEKNGVKNYYVSYLLDFPDAETFAWVLVTSVPSHIINNKEHLHNIVYSLTPIE